jgi:ubiquinone/menaquinone biosynthesis C-methylase UbiE
MGKNILEAGAGTCQLSLYLSIGNNNNIFALDGAINSLLLGKKFADQNNITNVYFVNADLLDNIFPDQMSARFFGKAPIAITYLK